jgi:hypothetical protein
LDLDRDGNLDLIQSVGSQFIISSGNGDGTFDSQEYYPRGYRSESFIIKDINLDGYLDISSVNGIDSLSIQFGAKEGRFSDLPLPTVSDLEVFEPILNDVNNDGLLDLISKRKYRSSADSNIISVALGNGNGTFRPKIDTNLGASFGSFIIEDIDYDGNSEGASHFGK